jgi:hypothetical protein
MEKPSKHMPVISREYVTIRPEQRGLSVDVRNADHQGVIETTFEPPTGRLRIEFSPFGKKDDSSRHFSHFIVTHKAGAMLLIATLRKCADMIEANLDKIPTRRKT